MVLTKQEQAAIRRIVQKRALEKVQGLVAYFAKNSIEGVRFRATKKCLLVYIPNRSLVM